MLMPCEGLMLLPLYVISSWLMLCQLTVGCHFILFKMADVIAMALSFWLMLLPYIVRCETTDFLWQVLLPLGVIG